MEPAIIDERQDVQKKTFTKWINAHLTKTNCPPVTDLFQDLRDGHKLLTLLEILTNSQYKPEKGRMRVHHINNLNKALQVLQEHDVKLVNISSDDIAAGNPKLTLGLVWLIALSFNGQSLVNSQYSNGIEKRLLSWVRQYTEPHNLVINDFSSSWSDGRAFLYIIHSNVQNFDLNAALKQHPNARLKMAFDYASRYFKIDQLLDPEDVNTSKPDKKSILMYVMCLYHAINTRGSIHDLVQHCDSIDEIQLLDEKSEIFSGSVQDDDNAKRQSDVKFIQKTTLYHPGNVTDLDEISLDKPTVASPSLVRSSTFTISKTNETGLRAMDINIDEPRSSVIAGTSSTDFLQVDSKSRPLSTLSVATNASIEITSYQAALEAVLTLLLEDEEILSQELPEPTDFKIAKAQFHENEQFMLKLTEHQQFVGEALDEGSILISESQRTSGLTIEDQNEIRQQMVLLNERWEILRVRALDVQSKILARLAEFQSQQVEKLRIFLTNAEDRISRMSDIGPTMADLERQTIELNQLINDLREQQTLVDNLSNMVVIVDDESGSFNDLEDKLAALGERWSHVIKWNEIRSEKLHQYKVILRWMDAREKDLKTMETKELTELGSIAKRVNDLRYCETDLNELQRYLGDLRQTVQTLQEGENIEGLEYIENLEDRLDALKEIVDIQKSRITSMGFEFPKITNEKKIERPDSWTDFQVIIKHGDGAGEDSDMSPQSNKKRRLQKTQTHYLLEGKIMENFNYLENLEERINEMTRLSLKDQSQMIEEIEIDLLKRIEDNPKELQSLYNESKQEDSSRNLSLQASQVEEITEKYENLKKKLDELKNSVKYLLAKEKFYNNLTGFKLVLADSRDWYNQHSINANREDLEKRLSYMESLSSEISEAKDMTVQLSDDLKEWKQDFDQFHQSWNDMKKAIIRLIQTKHGYEDVEDKMKILQEFIKQTESTNVIISDDKAMNSQLNNLQDLKRKYCSHEDDYQHVCEKGDPDRLSVFLEAWGKIPDIIHERVIKQNTAIENLNHFTMEYDSIIKKLKKLESTLTNDLFVLGEIQMLQNQVNEYDKHATELKKIEIDVISARNFSEIIIKEAETNHENQLQNHVADLNKFYTKVLDLYQQNSKKLHQILTTTEDILQRVHQTELWLNDLEMNTPKNKNIEIQNSNELFQIKTKFQSLKEKCEQETVKFRELNEVGGDMIIQIDDLIQQKTDKKYTHLAMKFTKLNARWNEVTTLVYNRTAELEHISNQLGELKKLIVSENGYLDKLEKKLRKSPENAADAEEMIEELDDLENNIRNHSDDRLEKIQDIGNELIDSEFMADSMQEELQAIMDRWNLLQQKANQRTQILEQEVSEAEKSEKCVAIFEKWLYRVDDILTEHMENDVTVEDLPHDFQRLAEEFRENEKTLGEVREMIAEHARKGKTEAANRLRDQLNLLESRFKSCQLKLDKCTAPQAGYESKLSRALAELRNVERTTLVLDVASAGPTSVHDQYQHCLKIYRTLSEIKGEIENTIKTGRRVCEDKFTKDPKQLGLRIDALKHLYNTLGESVTQAKVALEGLLKLARQLNESLDLTEKLIKASDTPDLAEVRNSKFQEIEEYLQKCENLYDEYAKACEPIYMEDTRQRIDNMRNRYLKLSSADVIKSLNEMKSTLQNLDNIPLETLKTMENDLQKINVADSEIENLHSQVIGIIKGEFAKRNTIIEDDGTEIVVVSDTVRLRRARTPSTHENRDERPSSEPSQQTKQIDGQNPNVLPDLLPKTFRLAETSSLFSQISQDDGASMEQESVEKRDKVSPKNKRSNEFSVVEIREKDLDNQKMSVQSLSLDSDKDADIAQVGQIVDTINILESVDSFEPEYVETVNIIDASEDTSDTDSSLRLEDKPRKRNLDELVEYESEKELEAICSNADDVELRSHPDKLLKIEKQRISFEEKRKRLETERDLLRDSEDLEKSKITKIKHKKPRHIRDMIRANSERDSFYNSDKENFDEPLVFSDDEDIPRFSLEMTTGVDSDSDSTSRIEGPKAKKSNANQNKMSYKEESNVISPAAPRHDPYKNSTSLEQRVHEFDKTARYMIRKLDTTKDKIDACSDGESAIEHLKLSIAPDAATLISQGDTLVLETHGKSSELSQIVMKTQTMLRDKFREVQRAKSPKTFIDPDIALLKEQSFEHRENQYSPSSGKIMFDKKFPIDLNRTKASQEINLDELLTKGLKRIYDLIEKPLDRKSEAELRKRIFEINDRQDDLKLAINAAHKSKSTIKAKQTMESLEKAKTDLAVHADSVETSLANLTTGELKIVKVTAVVDKQKNGNSTERDETKPVKQKEPYVPGSFVAKTKPKLISPSLAGSFDKSILQISDWLNWEKNMIKSQSIPVGDIDAIRVAIEKQRNVLRELEVKKPQLNELVQTAETLKTDVNRQQLQEKVTRLREHWDETSQAVLQRASQLKNMLGDSQRYESKRLEIETWLARMENRSDRMGTVATTADVLEAQQKEQKSFHAELHQYKHQIELFNALTQKLIAVYPSDDTSRIKRMTESVNQRYNNLNNAVINRGKLLHAAVHNLQSFDRSMDQFLAFLSEAESLCENAESEIDRNPLVLKVSFSLCCFQT